MFAELIRLLAWKEVNENKFTIHKCIKDRRFPKLDYNSLRVDGADLSNNEITFSILNCPYGFDTDIKGSGYTSAMIKVLFKALFKHMPNIEIIDTVVTDRTQDKSLAVLQCEIQFTVKINTNLRFHLDDDYGIMFGGLVESKLADFNIAAKEIDNEMECLRNEMMHLNDDIENVDYIVSKEIALV